MSNKQDNVKVLKVQTIELKVNIHCEGCKRKVKKKLQKIEDVYTVDVDAELQKVTITGNVTASYLINSLRSSGKHAELWPTSGKGNPQGKQQNERKVQFDLKDEKDLKPPKGNKDGGEGFDDYKEKKDKPNGTDANKGGGGGKKGGVGVGAVDAQNKVVGNGGSDNKQNNGSGGGGNEGAKNNGGGKKNGNQMQNPGKKPDGGEIKNKNGGGGKKQAVGDVADNQNGGAGGGGEGTKNNGDGNTNAANGNGKGNGGGKKAGKKGNEGDFEASTNANAYDGPGPVPGFNNPMHANGNVPGFNNPMQGHGNGNGCSCHHGPPAYDYGHGYNVHPGYRSSMAYRAPTYYPMGNSSCNDAGHYFSDENANGCSLM